jgi:hypothetical protein
VLCVSLEVIYAPVPLTETLSSERGSPPLDLILAVPPS